MRVANTASIPSASNISARNDLSKTTGLDVTNLNEARVKEEDVWRVESNTLCCTFPFDCAGGTTRIAVFVNIETKFF